MYTQHFVLSFIVQYTPVIERNKYQKFWLLYSQPSSVIMSTKIKKASNKHHSYVASSTKLWCLLLALSHTQTSSQRRLVYTVPPKLPTLGKHVEGKLGDRDRITG